MENIVCNLCGNNKVLPFYQYVPDYLLNNDKIKVNFVKCTSCGLIYQNPRPTLKEMSEHYPENYESYTYDDELNNSSTLLKTVYQYGINKRIRFVTHFKKHGRLLDLGCSTGIFLNGFKGSPNWNLFGVEINKKAAHIAQNKGLNVFTGTLEEANFPNEYFDVVTMWDVLEHLHDPASSLKEIYRILKPDGILVIRVPNENSWDAHIFGRYWSGLDAPRHLFIFTPITLNRMLSVQNFETIMHSSQIGAYTTFLLSVRFWKQAKHDNNLLINFIVNFLYHPIMRLITAPFFYLSGLGLKGPLLVTVAKKRMENFNDRNTSLEC